MADFQIFALYNGKVEVKFFPESHIYMVNGKRKTGVTTFLGIIDKSNALVIWATELFRDFLIEKLSNGGIEESHLWEGCDLHAVRKQQAADLGKEIHEWCEKYIKHNLKIKGYEKMPEMPEKPEVQIGVMAFLDWEKEHKVKFISSERVVYSKKHDFIGTMDIEAKIDGKLCLVDLKSSNGLYNTVRLQTAAYVLADEEESKRKYKGRWAIRLAKETKQEYDARMAKKNSNRARKGQAPVNYPEYRVFEARFFDENVDEMKRDKDVFLAVKKLFLWNKETDFFRN